MDMPSTPQALAEKAQAAYQNQNFPLAAQLYGQAAAAHSTAGAALLAAEMANNCSVAHLKAGNADAAYQAAKDTDKVFAQAGEHQKQAIALANQAAALEAANRLDEALDLYLQSSQILKEIHDQEMRPYVLQCIAALQLRTGRQMEALLSSEVALDMKKNLSVREKVLKKLLGTASKLLGR